MKGGRLKSQHHECGEYADQLKALDDALTAADSTRTLVMPHGAPSTYTSVVLDLIQDACQLYWDQSLPVGGSVSGGTGISTSAANIAAAMTAASEASKLESSKECTTTVPMSRLGTLSSSPSTRSH